MLTVFIKRALFATATRSIPAALAALVAVLSLPVAARAQLSRVPQVAALELEFANDPFGGILARQASDSLAVEMARGGRYDLLPRAQVERQMTESGLYQPLNPAGRQQLGQALGVDYVATGSVRGVSYDPRTRKGRASISVLLTEVLSGEYTNATAATGVASAPPGLAGMEAAQAAITQALASAAFLATRNLQEYEQAGATVLQTSGSDNIVLNQGVRGGIEVGQEMIVFRGGQRVGRIRVTGVSSDTAVARAVDARRGIRPEDRARAVIDARAYDAR